jgi:hypothetical protein
MLFPTSRQFEDISSIDFVGKLLGLNDIYSILVESSMSVQKVSSFPWEYTSSIEKMKTSLASYAEEVQKLNNNLNNTQEMEGEYFCPFSSFSYLFYSP